MSVFYRLGLDGKNVFVVKSLLSKDISDEDFKRRAKKISVEDFSSRFSSEIAKKLKEEIDLLKTISNHLVNVKVFRSKYIDYSYTINGKEFLTDSLVGINSSINQSIESAIKYVKDNYGDDFCEKVEVVLKTPKKYVDKELTYFKTKDGVRELSEDQKQQLRKTLHSLTKIKSMDRLANKYLIKRHV